MFSTFHHNSSFALPYALCAFTAALVAACGNEDGAEEHSLEVEGCMHMQDGPDSAATAATTAAEALGGQVAELVHHRATIALPAGAAGAIKFEIEHDGEYVLYLNTNVTVTVRDANGAEMQIEQTETHIQECPNDVAVLHVLDLKAGFYTLEVDATTSGSIKAVLAPVEGEHEHA